MFLLTYRPKNDRDHSQVDYFTDIKDLGQAVLNLTDSEKEANSAMKWCDNATFGNKVTRQPNYKIECINEVEMEKELLTVVDAICRPFNIGRSQAFWDNDALTVDIEPGLSWIKFNHNYGYYIVLNKIQEDQSHKELFSVVEKDKKKFIDKAIIGIGKAFPEYAKIARSNSQAHRGRFVVGYTYIGCKQKSNDKMTIIITKRTPQYVYYETDTGIQGRVKIGYMNGSEAIMIEKADKLIVHSLDKWS